MQELLDASNYYIESLNRGHVREFLNTDPFRTRMTILLGQRGVGKTTVIIQYILSVFRSKQQLKHALYLPADHISISGRSLYEIAKEFYQLGGKLICFDEIHKYKNWSQELKNISDTFADLKVIASGSAALEVHKGSHDLSRRAIVRYLPGLSFREYITLKLGIKLKAIKIEDIILDHFHIASEILQKIEKKKVNLQKTFHEYLKKGYYPYFLEYKRDEDYYNVLEQSVNAAIESDLPAVHPSITGASITKIKQLMAFIAKQVPFKPNLGSLTSALELSDQRVLKTFLKYLSDAELINTLGKGGTRFSTLEKPQKIYLNNTNQAYAFGKHLTNVGNIRETFFLNALQVENDISYSEVGDFNVNGTIFEVGGKSKTYRQIKGIRKSFLALDNIETGTENTIPLWLFGFLN